MRWFSTWGQFPPTKVWVSWRKMSFGCIGFHFRYRVTIHRRHWPCAKTLVFSMIHCDPEFWNWQNSSFWVPNWTNLWVRMAPRAEGQGGPGYGPQEPKMNQKSPNIILLVAKNGQREHQKRDWKRLKSNHACLFELLIRPGESTFLS